jgi:CheY-like chemotaxis protein
MYAFASLSLTSALTSSMVSNVLYWHCRVVIPDSAAIFDSHALSNRGGCVMTASSLLRPLKLSSCSYPEENVAMDSPTLLCIDDRPQMLELRKATLESQGYCVKLASSGYTAIKTLEKTSVAAVLLEYKLEGMDAEAVACHIKHRFPNLPIILLSAYPEMPERILWLVDEYVMKSELPERLVPIIERAHRRLDERYQRNGTAA